MSERLQKFIASSGLASRRKAEELIVDGKVQVNGEIVTKLGTTIDPHRDAVTVNGKPIARVTAFRYIALYKPSDVVCTRAQHKSERTVYDLVPNSRDLVIAGRLDKDSEGLVILTNDGELVNKLTHPRYGHTKEYEVTTMKPLDHSALNTLRRGVKLPEGTGKFDAIEEIGRNRYRIILHQGWKRQIRRMIGKTRNDVVKLHRVRISALSLGNLASGEWHNVERGDIVTKKNATPVRTG